MPSLNFQQKFADDVAAGEKRQTIRAPRKKPIRVGDTLYLFTGQRTKNCRRLGVGICTDIHDFEFRGGLFVLDGIALTTPQEEQFAQDDGFIDREAMDRWFSMNYSLEGDPFIVIKWRLLK